MDTIKVELAGQGRKLEPQPQAMLLEAPLRRRGAMRVLRRTAWRFGGLLWPLGVGVAFALGVLLRPAPALHAQHHVARPPHRVHAAARPAPIVTPRVVRDPVCGHAVDPRSSPWMLELSSATLYFDSEACLLAYYGQTLNGGRVVMRLRVPAAASSSPRSRPVAKRRAVATRPVVHEAPPPAPSPSPKKRARPADAPPSIAEPYAVDGPTVPGDPSIANLHSLLKQR